MKHNVKNIIKYLAAVTGKHRWKISQPGLAILAYHRILPRDDARYRYEQPAMVVTPETFEQNIIWASKYFSFIKLSDWLDRCRSNTINTGRYCAVTFDDGWIDNLEFALPILEKHRIPATLFCVSNMISENCNYWPGLATRLVQELSKSNIDKYISRPECTWLDTACKTKVINWENPDRKDINVIIESLKIYEDMQIYEFITQTKQSFNLNYIESRQVLNIEELKRMINTGLIEIGSHTTNHVRFTELTSPDVLQQEIAGSKHELSSMLGVDVNVFCYPNGYHPDNSIEVCRQHYLGACTLEKGWNYCDSDYSVLKRVSLHEAVASSKTQFLAKLSGWI